MASHRVYISEEEANYLGLPINPSGVYRLSKKNHIKVLKFRAETQEGITSTIALKKLKELYGINFGKTTDENIEVSINTETQTNQYSNKKDEDSEDVFRKCSAWKEDGRVMDITEYCNHYGFPYDEISSYKLVTHTGTPYYNIAFKLQYTKGIADIDFESIIHKHIKDIQLVTYNFQEPFDAKNDFDVLTYTDTHIGMDPDPKGVSMYPATWNKKDIMGACEDTIDLVLKYKSSDVLVIDDLGDFFDGLGGYTTRGGHELPQCMSDEEAWDLGRRFKLVQISRLGTAYKKIIINIIVNDNHSGKFSYFMASSFKDQVELMLDNVDVNIHQQFLNHYMVGEFLFIITHGKDADHMKHGMKVDPDKKDLDRVDQYLKANKLYSLGKKIVLKKGDSHQAVFNYAVSDDFWYFNYPAISPNSDWIKTNFKKGSRGFVFESYKGRELDKFKPKFY